MTRIEKNFIFSCFWIIEKIKLKLKKKIKEIVNMTNFFPTLCPILS